MIPELLEALASLEHDRWGRWQEYLHSTCEEREDGSLVISAANVKHWERQICTKYAELSETEKESDRKEARATLRTLAPYSRSSIEKAVQQALDHRSKT